jgi:hypothetical protein
MMKARITTPMIAMANTKQALVRPTMNGARYVPTNGIVVPTSDPPMKPAMAPIAANGMT